MPTAGASCGGASLISALGRLREENCMFKASLGYLATSCLRMSKTNKKPKQQQNAHSSINLNNQRVETTQMFITQ
jgi:hypothetical protein